MPAKKNYYAVKNGRIPGIYLTWDDCKKQVMGYSQATFKGFATKEEAVKYLEGTEDDGAISDAVAYVDGSFLKEEARYSFGAVIIKDGKEEHFNAAFSNPEMAAMRNVAGEITGAQFVMQYCIDNDINSVDIYYDYEGIEKWCSGEWKTNRQGTAAYKEFYEKISEKLTVHFVKVRGHSGVKYNELADKLAKEALGIAK